MSRIGRKPIALGDKVQLSTSGRTVKVKGPLGELDAILPEGVKIEVSGDVATVTPPPSARGNRGYQGLVRALLANMVEGVTHGYQRSLAISGVGYKCEHKGQRLVFTLGYSHQIDLDLPKGISAEVDKSQTNVTIKGIDKQLVGQVAAQIRSYKIPEPYKGKGVRYSDETIKRKVGKAGSK